MNGWNRLFVVIAVCWVVVAPLLLTAEGNRPVEQMLGLCSDAVYQAPAILRVPTWKKYRAE